MIKVAMIVLSYYPADPRVRREAEVLEQSGISVDIICLRGPKEKFREKFGNITAYRVLKGTANKESIVNYLFLSGIFCIKSFSKLLSLSFSKKYSLIQIHNMPNFLVFTGIMHKIIGRPIILDLHDLVVELFESKWGRGKNNLLLRLVMLEEKISCRFADYLITTSKGFKEKLIERGIYPQKITLILNSADESIFKVRSPQHDHKIKNQFNLLYHGTIAKRFGLHIAVECITKLKNIIPGIKLYIYGKYDPSYRDELERLIERLKLNNNVILGNFQIQEDIADIINNSDLGIVPYLSDSFMNLALSTKTFEYVCMKLPVVASKLESLRIIFGENSIRYFKPGDPEDLAKKIVTLYEKPELKRKSVDRAFAVYQQYKWSKMKIAYLDLIKNATVTNYD